MVDLTQISNPKVKSIVGDFYAGKWGTFKVYFNFEMEHEKITRLDIGQVSRLKN